MLRQRPSGTKSSTATTTPRATQSSKIGALPKGGHDAGMDGVGDPRVPLLGPTGTGDGAALSQRHLSSPSSSEDQSPGVEHSAEPMENLSRKSQWIILALASGACAAFNGVFAKLYVFSLSLPRVPGATVGFSIGMNERIYVFSYVDYTDTGRWGISLRPGYLFSCC
jgi:hypothetical protein